MFADRLRSCRLSSAKSPDLNFYDFLFVGESMDEVKQSIHKTVISMEVSRCKVVLKGRGETSEHLL